MNFAYRRAKVVALVDPDRAALEVAHRMLRATASLDDMLKNPALRLVLRAVARRHMKRRSQVDLKKLAANDLEDHP